MLKYLFIGTAVLYVVGVARCEEATTQPVVGGVAASDVAKTYKQLRLMTKEPVAVDPFLSALCRNPTSDEVKDARDRSGPHAMSSINIYMNDLAADAFTRRAKSYAVGAIVVKEKWSSTGGVGGMIKRPPGYDAEHGDWEFFYGANAAHIESGKIASCVQCHRAAASTDHVFGNWARRE